MDYSDADDLRKLQADTAEEATRDEVPETTEADTAPPLADTADPGYAERMERLRSGLPDDVRVVKLSELAADPDGAKILATLLGYGCGECDACKQAAAKPAGDRPEQPEPDLLRQACGDVNDPYGRTCTRVAGHPGQHAEGDLATHLDGQALAWPSEDRPAPRLDARVRILELPHHRGAIVAGVMRAPFALVVDMLGTLEHVGAQEAFWTEHGKAMGAVRTIVAAGTIDLDGAQL